MAYLAVHETRHIFLDGRRIDRTSEHLSSRKSRHMVGVQLRYPVLVGRTLGKNPNLIKRTKPQPTGWSELIILFGYLANMLPFMVVPRGMFLYHYLPALIFAILGIGPLLDRVDRNRMLGTILLAASIFGFVYFAPLTYGIPVSKAAMSRMFWFDGWR
jgi:dolichyl-phosphate-mannose--protein O-mannosyl transferase